MEQISAWHIYLYGIYPSISGLLEFSVVVILVVAAIIGAVDLSKNNNFGSMVRSIRGYLIATVALVILNVLMPPRSIAIAMVALEPTKEMMTSVADSNRTQKLTQSLDNVLDYIVKRTASMDK